MAYAGDSLAGLLFIIVIIVIVVWQVPNIRRFLDRSHDEEPESLGSGQSEGVTTTGIHDDTHFEELGVTMTNEMALEGEETARTIEIDPVYMNMLRERLRSQQNLIGGILAGVVAASVGAILWAVITVATEFQIGFMAIAVGFLVGFAIRTVGKGIDTVFGIVGGVLALLGCAVGNLLAICGLLAKHNDIPYFTVLSVLEVEAVKNLMVVGFSPIDLLFYGFAVFEGYKFSFRRPTAGEMESILPPK